MSNVISILSGGLDSAVSTSIAHRQHRIVKAVTFNYGQKAARCETDAAAYLCNRLSIKHNVLELKLLGGLGGSSLTSDAAKTAWVPNRNGVFINMTAAIAEAEGIDIILAGFNREEAGNFPDNSREFVDLTNRCLKYSTLTHPTVVSYVQEMDKVEILKAAMKLEIEVERLWVCYEGGEKWCGLCESCARTARAMKQLGVINRYETCFSRQEYRL